MRSTNLELLMLLSLALFACTSPDTSDKSGDTAGDTATTTGVTFDVVAQPTTVSDVTPTPDGSGMYYLGDAGSTLCFVEGTDTPLCVTGPFAGATSLDVTEDGETLAMTSIPGGDPGAAAATLAVHVVNALCDATGWCGPGTLGGTLEMYEETIDYEPKAIDIGKIDEVETIVFSGMHDGLAGVYSIPVAGGSVSTLVADIGAVASGVTIALDGTVYAAANVGGVGTVFTIKDDAATVLASGITLGDPAGLAISPDEGAVMASALLDGKSAVAVIARADGTVTYVTKTIKVNTGSGGLHRAPNNAAVYGWNGYTGSGSSVYRVSFE